MGSEARRSGASAEGSGRGDDGGAASPPELGAGKLRLLAGVAGGILVLDQLTKWWVVQSLTLHEIVPVVGDVVRLTYTHNFGAAFGIDVGRYSRVFFLTLALLALVVLVYLFVHTPSRRRLRLWALSLITGGALGNIVDRIRYEEGVVDFLDVGIGTLRWPVFNVADMGVSVGAVLLLVTFYREETRSAGAESSRSRERGGESRGANGRARSPPDEPVPARES